jgi:hypothetical protein
MSVETNSRDAEQTAAHCCTAQASRRRGLARSGAWAQTCPRPSRPRRLSRPGPGGPGCKRSTRRRHRGAVPSAVRDPRPGPPAVASGWPAMGGGARLTGATSTEVPNPGRRQRACDGVWRASSSVSGGRQQRAWRGLLGSGSPPAAAGAATRAARPAAALVVQRQLTPACLQAGHHTRRGAAGSWQAAGECLPASRARGIGPERPGTGPAAGPQLSAMPGSRAGDHYCSACAGDEHAVPPTAQTLPPASSRQREWCAGRCRRGPGAAATVERVLTQRHRGRSRLSALIMGLPVTTAAI